MMKLLVKAFVLSVTAGTLVALPSTPAAADRNDSGFRDCNGNGNIVMGAGFQTYHGVDVAVKQAGPPTSPTWGTTKPPNHSASPRILHRVAWVSPYQAGTWSAHTTGEWLHAGTQCSIKDLPSGSDIIRSLGDKACADKNVWVYVDTGAEIWISYRSNEDSQYKRIAFTALGSYPFTDVNTRETSIYDVVVRIYHGDILNDVGVKCGPRGF